MGKESLGLLDLQEVLVSQELDEIAQAIQSPEILNRPFETGFSVDPLRDNGEISPDPEQIHRMEWLDDDKTMVRIVVSLSEYHSY